MGCLLLMGLDVMHLCWNFEGLLRILFVYKKAMNWVLISSGPHLGVPKWTKLEMSYFDGCEDSIVV